jgi:ribonuclease-3
LFFDKLEIKNKEVIKMKLNIDLTVCAEDLEKFQKIIGVRFDNTKYLIQSLLHGSIFSGDKAKLENFRKINKLDADNYEKLEYLGDSALGLIVAEYSYNEIGIEEYAKAQGRKIEGVLTDIKIVLVSNDNLKPLAGQINLDNYILCGDLEDANNIYANVIEALIGSIYLDQGYAEAKNFVYHFFNIKGALDKIDDSNPIGKFQAEAVKRGYKNPEYRDIDQWGPDNDKHFKRGLYLNDNKVAEGEGSTKKEANKRAAQIGLIKMRFS